MNCSFDVSETGELSCHFETFVVIILNRTVWFDTELYTKYFRK